MCVCVLFLLLFRRCFQLHYAVGSSGCGSPGFWNILSFSYTKEKSYSNRTLRKARKKFTTRGLFIGAMSRVKLIAETRVYICHKNTKSMGIFYSCSKVFTENTN